MKQYIYCISNIINNKSYIGQSINANKRYIDHIHGKDSVINRAIKKYGKENFIFQIIEECESYDETNEMEIFYIGYLNTKVPNGYNIEDGGRSATMNAYTKSKLSKSLKNYISTANLKEDNSRAKKINSEIAVKIYLDGLNYQLTLKNISTKYGIKTSAIHNILHRNTWTNATKNLPDINFNSNQLNSRGRKSRRIKLTNELAQTIINDFNKSGLTSREFAIKNYLKYDLLFHTVYKMTLGRHYINQINGH